MITIHFSNASKSVAIDNASITLDALLDKVNALGSTENYNIEDISMFGDSDVSGLPENIKGSLSLESDGEISIDAEFADPVTREPEQVAPAAETISVQYGAGMIAPIVMAIIKDVTTVGTVIDSDTVKRRTGKTTEQLHGCKLSVNDSEVTLGYVLSGGERIVIEERVAGDKGSDDAVVYFYDRYGEQIGCMNIRENKCIADCINNAPVELFANVDEDMYLLERHPEHYILRLNGEQLSEGLRGTIAYHYAVQRGDEVMLDCAVVDNEDAEEDQAEEDRDTMISDELIRGMQRQAEALSDEQVTICLGAGINPLTVKIHDGAKLSDVLFDPSVLNRLHQTVDDVKKSNVSCNGTLVTTFEIALSNGDSIRIEARTAGDKGLN